MGKKQNRRNTTGGPRPFALKQTQTAIQQQVHANNIDNVLLENLRLGSGEELTDEA